MDPRVEEILEKVKASAGNAASVAEKVATTAGKKAGDLFEITKANLQIFDLNSDIDILFKQIGKSVYLTHTGQEVDENGIEIQIAAIDEKYEKINELKAQIATKKNNVTCPQCGAECDKTDAFCKRCGKAL